MFRIAICDDEKEVCTQIEDILLDFSQSNKHDTKVNLFNDGEEVLKHIKQGNNFDLIFLDIEMTLLSGIEVGKVIREVLHDNITQIVYISSKQGYAMELFEVRPLHFLIKPIDREAVIKCCRRALYLADRMNLFFEFTVENERHKVAYKDIVYLESNGRKTKIITAVNTYEYYGKLSDAINSITDNEFIHIHKSYLANYRYVIKSSHDSLTMASGQILPISKAFRKDVREKLLRNRNEGEK